MPLPPGSRLGPYEIVAPLGAGGMGAVFSARDTRLGRAVAIKVILESFASDAERIARFEREARMLAALHHPRIASLFGMEQSDGRHFLVMELVEGETIADRLRRGRMPVEEAVAIGLQIAEALEAAHEKGVVHRDLKPANVKVTPDHQVKVLDFGLAKAVENEPNAADAANSPTLSMMATQAGVILGTAAYMSPEQAKGFPADHRSDVFSFGSVMFEMLTGRQPFQGDTAPEVLASVLVREADLNALPGDLNPRLIDLIRRCLEKSPKRRWQHIGDVRAELESLAGAPRSVVMTAVHAPARPFWRRALAPAAFGITAAALTGAAAWTLRPEPPRGIVRLEMQLPEGQAWSYMGRNVLDISRDGSRIVYVPGNKLYVRELAEFAGAPVAGAASIDRVSGPALSPDGRYVAVFAVGEEMLKKIPVGGGAAVNLCKTGNPMGVFWADDGWIYFTSTLEGVRRISENGGKPETLVPPSEQERVHGPRPLAGGEHLLMSVARGAQADRWEVGQIVAHNLRTGARKVLVDGASDGRLLPGGVLAFAQRGVVYGVPFDERTLEVRGAPVPILEGVRRSPGNASATAHYAFADNGTLVYLDGPATPADETEVLITAGPNGVTPLKMPPGTFRAPRVSRDGKRLVFDRTEGVESIFVYDLDGSSAPRRLTFEGRNIAPIFSADGQHVVFARDSDNVAERGLYWTRTDGTGPIERLTQATDGQYHVPESWSPDGRTLLFSSGIAGRWALWALSMPDRKTRQISAATGVAPFGAAFSPDGAWIAYAVPSGTQHNIFLEPFPTTGAKFEMPRLTSEDPHHPVWAPDGKSIYYTSRPNNSAVIPVTFSGRTLSFGNPVPFQQAYRTAAPTSSRTHDILPDGRFVGLASAGTPEGRAGGSAGSLRFVLNWFEDFGAKLQRR